MIENTIPDNKKANKPKMLNWSAFIEYTLILLPLSAAEKFEVVTNTPTQMRPPAMKMYSIFSSGIYHWIIYAETAKPMVMATLAAIKLSRPLSEYTER